MKHYCEFAVRALPSLALLLYLLNNTISYYSIYSIRLPTVIDRKFGSHLCCEASGYALPYEKVVSLLVRQHGGGWALWQMKDGSPGAAGNYWCPTNFIIFLQEWGSLVIWVNLQAFGWCERNARRIWKLIPPKICILLVWANDSMDMLRFILLTSDNGRFANDPV